MKTLSSSQHICSTLGLGLFIACILIFTGCAQDAPSTQNEMSSEHADEATHEDEHDDHDDHEDGHDDHGSTEITLSAQARSAVHVETVEVQRLPVGSQHQYNGRVVPIPDQEALVTSMIAGRLERVLVNAGDRVSAGQTVAVVNGPEVGQLVAELRHTATDLDTQKRLDARGVAVRNKLIEAQTAFDEAQSHLRSIGMSMDDIDAIAAGGEVPSGLYLKAPASGVVVSRNATVGGPVSPGDVLFHIADLTPIWVEADVYERDLGTIQPGGTVSIQTVAGNATRLSGTVRQILPGIDRERRVSVVQIQVENDKGILQPEMFVTVSVTSGDDWRPAVPVEAVLTDGIESYLIVAENDSTFRRVDIAASADAAGNVPVPELSAGTVVVTTGAFQIHSAMSGVEAGHAH